MERKENGAVENRRFRRLKYYFSRSFLLPAEVKKNKQKIKPLN